MLATNHRKDNFPRGQFPGGLSRSNNLEAVSRSRQLSSEGIVLGNQPGGQLSGGQFSSGAIVRTPFVIFTV